MILLQGLMDSLEAWHSNLECFLKQVTPMVPSQSLSEVYELEYKFINSKVILKTTIIDQIQVQ